MQSVTFTLASGAAGGSKTLFNCIKEANAGFSKTYTKNVNNQAPSASATSQLPLSSMYRNYKSTGSHYVGSPSGRQQFYSRNVGGAAAANCSNGLLSGSTSHSRLSASRTPHNSSPRNHNNPIAGMVQSRNRAGGNNATSGVNYGGEQK